MHDGGLVDGVTVGAVAVGGGGWANGDVGDVERRGVAHVLD